jgi:hypothetical protein
VAETEGEGELTKKKKTACLLCGSASGKQCICKAELLEKNKEDTLIAKGTLCAACIDRLYNGRACPWLKERGKEERGHEQKTHLNARDVQTSG